MWLLPLFSCGSDPAPSAAPPETPPVPPLYELLYAGEHGPEAARLGDRVRILAWLAALAPTPGQATSLHAASRATRADLSELAQARAEVDAVEVAALGPAYRAMATALVEGAAPDDAPLRAARATLPDGEVIRAQVARSALDRASAFVETLTTEQRAPTAQALFFLRAPVSSQRSPGEWDRLVGASWDPGDFGTIARTDPGPEAPASLDLGGLWRVDGIDGLAQVEELRLTTVVGMALAHPGLCGAIEAREGRRAPDDLDESCR